jgi:hypothetical protein
MPYSSKRFTPTTAAILFSAWSVLAAVACGQPMSPVDSGTDIATGEGGDGRPSDVTSDGGECMSDSECSNGLFCDGEERCLSGRCQPGSPPCDDHASCTTDTCDESTTMHCAHAPDHTVCTDHNDCNGVEQCAPGVPGSLPGTGCQPVRPDNFVDCDDSNTCTIDICDPTVGCVHAPRDLDGDGVVDRACPDGVSGMQGTDCNDGDPTVYPGAPEICDDSRDNNCNGLADYLDTAAGCRPMNDSCAGARVLTGPGRYFGTNALLSDSFTLSCNSIAARDSVYAFTLSEPHDVRIGMSDMTMGAAIAVADSCAMGAVMDLACSRAINTGTFGVMVAPSIFIRSLPAGTYYLFVETPSSSPFTFTLSYEEPTTPPAGDACPPNSPAVDLASGVPQTLDTTTLVDDFSVSCNPGLPQNDAVFRLHLDALSNAQIDVTGPSDGMNFVSLRQGCPGSQLRCSSGASVTGSFRDLAAGDYFVIVENTMPGPVTATATITPGGMRVTGDACSTAASVPLGSTLPYAGNATVDFSTLLAGADYGTTCGSMSTQDPPWRDAVYTFTLGADADTTVTVTPTGGWTPSYHWAIESTCGSQGSMRGRCQSGSGSSPTSAVFFGVPAGTYYVVVETDTTPPAGAGFRVNVSAIDPSMRPQYEVCPGANVPLSASGTNLTGSLMVDGSSPMLDRNAQNGTSCGSASSPANWTDMVFNFTIPDRRSVSVNFGSSSPPLFWFVEAETMCGVQSSGIPLSVSGGASATCSFVAGGGSGTDISLGSLDAGTYYLVFENTDTTQGPTHLSITASP